MLDMINKALSLPRLFKRLAFVEQFEFLGKEGENVDQPTTTMEILTHKLTPCYYRHTASNLVNWDNSISSTPLHI